MWAWAEPVIIDRTVEVYARAVDHAGTMAMARRHCRLWRDALLGVTAEVSPMMDGLRRAAASLGLPEDVIHDANDVILEEMVDIITSRYRSSRNSIRTFSMVLMAATSCLGTVRSAA